MKQKLKKYTSVFLAVIMVFGVLTVAPFTVSATQNRTVNFNKNFALTGNGSDDIVSVAAAQLGKTGSQLGYSEQWCADFVSDCAILANQADAIPAAGYCPTLRQNIINAGGSYVSIYDAKKGDIVFYGSNGADHVEIVYAASNGNVSTYGGNSGSGSSLYTRSVRQHATQTQSIAYIVRPNYSNPNPPDQPIDNYVDIGTNFYAVIKNTQYNNYVSIIEDSNNICLQGKNNSSGQVWYFEQQSDGAYVISSCYNGKVLEMTNGVRENGTQITAHDDYWGGYYQQWYLLDYGNGYRLLSKHFTSEQWYLDRSNNSDNNGNKVQIYEKASDEDQIWTIDKESAFSDLGDKFYSVISNTKYGGYVSKVDGTDNIYLQDNNNTSKQIWYFERQNDGAYAISSCYDGKYLEMSSGIRENKTQISAPNDYWGGYYQQWYLIPYGSGFKILSKHYTSEGWYLDRSVNADSNGNYVQIYEKFWNADDQVWTIDKESAFSDLGDKFYSVISNTKYGGYISKVEGTDNIYLQDNNNTSKQKWYFERQNDGAYAISSCYDGKYLEMSSGIRENKTQISAPNDYWGGYYQQWYLIPYGSGFKILSKHYTSEGWYLDRSVNADSNGNYVQIYEKFWNADDQVWTIEKRAPYSIGDVDCDGIVSITDATLIQMYLVNIVDLSDEQLAVADADSDGVVNITDATTIQLHLVGLIPNLG